MSEREARNNIDYSSFSQDIIGSFLIGNIEISSKGDEIHADASLYIY